MLVYVSPGLAEMFGHAGEPAEKNRGTKKSQRYSASTAA